MTLKKSTAISYKCANFAAQLPEDYLYTPSHFWAAQSEQNLWRIGFTKFATRMLGEIVEHGFDVETGTPIKPGQIIGWVEGFKAVTDLFCIVKGTFVGANPLLKDDIGIISRDPCGAGWLYSANGTPDPQCIDVHAYCAILDATIGRLLEKPNPE